MLLCRRRPSSLTLARNRARSVSTWPAKAVAVIRDNPLTNVDLLQKIFRQHIGKLPRIYSSHLHHHDPFVFRYCERRYTNRYADIILCNFCLWQEKKLKTELQNGFSFCFSFFLILVRLSSVFSYFILYSSFYYYILYFWIIYVITLAPLLLFQFRLNSLFL